MAKTESLYGGYGFDTDSAVFKNQYTVDKEAAAEALAETNETLNETITGKIADLVDGAPEALDTLKEVADELTANKEGDDALAEKVETLENTTVPALDDRLTTAEGSLATVTETTIPALDGRVTTLEGKKALIIEELPSNLQSGQALTAGTYTKLRNAIEGGADVILKKTRTVTQSGYSDIYTLNGISNNTLFFLSAVNVSNMAFQVITINENDVVLFTDQQVSNFLSNFVDYNTLAGYDYASHGDVSNSIDSALYDNATQTWVSSNFLSSTDAYNVYLSKTDAGSIYLTKTDAANTYALQSAITNLQQQIDAIVEALSTEVDANDINEMINPTPKVPGLKLTNSNDEEFGESIAVARNTSIPFKLVGENIPESDVTFSFEVENHNNYIQVMDGGNQLSQNADYSFTSPKELTFLVPADANPTDHVFTFTLSHSSFDAAVSKTITLTFGE